MGILAITSHKCYLQSGTLKTVSQMFICQSGLHWHPVVWLSSLWSTRHCWVRV